MSKIHKSQELAPLWKLVADWRAMSIVHAIFEHKSVRYGQLQNMLSMSPTTLSYKTKELAEHGVIVRKSNPKQKVVCYEPTQLAAKIVDVYHSLEEIIQPNENQR